MTFIFPIFKLVILVHLNTEDLTLSQASSMVLPTLISRKQNTSDSNATQLITLTIQIKYGLVSLDRLI